MTHLQPRRSRWALGALILLGCGPKVQEFKVEPRRVCVGDTVRITYKIRGTPHLLSVRHGGALADTTTYMIVAEARGKKAYSVMDVVTFLPAATPSLAFTTDTLGADSLIARDSIRAETWPDLLRINDIFSGSGRRLVVRHGNREGVVGPGRSAVWRGLAVNGAWEIRTGLMRGEAPGDPARHPPSHLYLKLSLSCQMGARP
jgi:hypothetical protein